MSQAIRSRENNAVQFTDESANVVYDAELRINSMTTKGRGWAPPDEIARKSIAAGWRGGMQMTDANDPTGNEIIVTGPEHPRYAAAIQFFVTAAFYEARFTSFTPRTLEDHRAVAAAFISFLQWKGVMLPEHVEQKLPADTRRQLETMRRLQPGAAALLPGPKRAEALLPAQTRREPQSAPQLPARASPRLPARVPSIPAAQTWSGLLLADPSLPPATRRDLEQRLRAQPTSATAYLLERTNAAATPRYIVPPPARPVEAQRLPANTATTEAAPVDPNSVTTWFFTAVFLVGFGTTAAFLLYWTWRAARALLS
jgi:hypothetical protein